MCMQLAGSLEPAVDGAVGRKTCLEGGLELSSCFEGLETVIALNFYMGFVASLHVA